MIQRLIQALKCSLSFHDYKAVGQRVGGNGIIWVMECPHCENKEFRSYK